MSSLRRPFPFFLFGLIVLLLTAVSFRLYRLTEIPPGLTHDEADHGLTAWEITQGRRDIYFTIGYGREPLYDYLTAGMMTLIGPNVLALRLTAVFFSLLLLVAMVAWVRRAFDAPTALFTLAGLAVDFWPVMSGRQALRSTLLPGLFALAVYFGWRALTEAAANGRIWRHRSQLAYILLAGLCLGLTFYVYIPARVLWGVFPVVGLYWLWVDRAHWRQIGIPLLGVLAVAAVVGWPLFHFLQTHPDVEARVQELSTPLRALAQGNLQPVLQHTGQSLRLFMVAGDTTWRYNIPGRPFLSWPMGVLFYLGVGWAGWQAIRPFRSPGANRKLAGAAVLALAWLLAGISPVFITGPQLSMTQAIGAQPMVYLFPAVTLAWLWRWAKQRRRWAWLVGMVVGLLLLGGGTAVNTARDYFVTWANAPDVRVQYESTMLSMLDYVQQHPANGVAISTITPAALHSPAVARLTLPADRLPTLRWFDGRGGLIVPATDSSLVLFPGFAALPPTLERYWQTAVLQTTLPLRPTDIDRPVTVYAVDRQVLAADWQTLFHPLGRVTYLGDAPAETAVKGLMLRGYDLAGTSGDVVQLVTWWQVVGPLPNLRLFTHVWDENGRPLAQADSLFAPAEVWQPGDWLLQWHTFVLPADLTGEYALVVGAYDPITGHRLLVWQNGQPTGDVVRLTVLPVVGGSVRP